MANTLTNLIPTIYAAADVILRELTGFIPAVTLFASADQVSKDQVVRYPIVASYEAGNVAAAATGPDPADTVVGSDTMTITKERSVTFYWTGNDQKGLGEMYEVILRDQFAQAMRTLVNEVETDLGALYVHASRAYGTAGSTPFDSTNKLSYLAQLLKILEDNGAPTSDLQFVMNTSAAAALRSLTELSSVGDAGSDTLLRRGVLGDIFDFAVRRSAKVANHTKGNGSGYLVNLTAGYAAGSTSVIVDTGSNNVLAGDVITNTKTSRDTNKYVVKTGIAAAGTLVLQNPGTRVAWENNDPLAIGNSYAANLGFSRTAIHALLRVPAMPEGGDAADDVTVVTDPQTGISFQVAMYRQRRRVAYEVGLAWGVKAVKPEAIAILLG